MKPTATQLIGPNEEISGTLRLTSYECDDGTFGVALEVYDVSGALLQRLAKRCASQEENDRAMAEARRILERQASRHPRTRLVKMENET